MTQGRRAVTLTASEIDEFLADHLKVQVATIGLSGAPHLSTLFYVMQEGRIGFWTYASSQKIKNLRRDPRVSCLVEDGDDYSELRGVSITGTATLVEEYDDIRALGTRVMARMAGGVDLGEFGEEIVNAQARKRVGVLITPDHIASWDHRKMTALPGQSNES